jgi:hypothetical protein
VNALDFGQIGLSKEVILVDGGSQDRTLEIARSVRGVKTFQLPAGSHGRSATAAPERAGGPDRPLCRRRLSKTTFPPSNTSCSSLDRNQREISRQQAVLCARFQRAGRQCCQQIFISTEHSLDVKTTR